MRADENEPSALNFIRISAQIFLRRDGGKRVAKLNKYARQKCNFVNGKFASDCIGKCRHCARQFERVHFLIPFALRVRLGFMHRTKRMLRRRVERIELQGSVARVDDVMPRARGNEDSVIAVHTAHFL